MPLRVDIRKDTGTLWIQGTVKPAGAITGRRIRQRAGSDDPAKAREEAAAIEAKILRDFHLGERPATHSFLEACQSYLKHQERSVGTKGVVRRLALYWQGAALGSITQEAVDRARRKILRAGAGDATWRKTVAILSAIINHAAKRKWCEPASFDLPANAPGRTQFLLPSEFERLHEAAPMHLKPLLTYLVCTGSRLGEALALDWSQVDLAGRRVNVWADQTKGGQRRVVDLAPSAVRALAGLEHRSGRVFRPIYAAGRAFGGRSPAFRVGEAYRNSDSGGGQIKSAWRTMVQKSGIYCTPHELRHTFATWHWALHRDLIALQHAGGWSSIELVTRYAHLLPSGLEPEIRRIWGVDQVVVRVA